MSFLLIFPASQSGLSFSCRNSSSLAEVRVGVVLAVQAPFPLCVSHCAVLEDSRLQGEGDTWGWGGACQAVDCILDSFVDHDGYSISSEGFLPAVVDIMVI